MSTCQICDELLNQSTRKCISCPYCNFAACRTCCETYVLGESVVKCMSPACGRDWTRQHIRDAFTAAFIKGRLKQRREQLLFDNERALLPATQPLVERKIQTEVLNVKINQLTRQINALRVERSVAQNQLSSVLRNQALNPVQRVEFIKACPDEGCRGFLSSQWKCGLCEQWACPECHEIKGFTRDAEHTCNPETVATVQLLGLDTKPCPNCRTGIYKINGCDQMWCTQCHTAFNWRTGRIEANVHNPHYFEWLRRNGNEVPRAAGDIPCQHNDITHHTYTQIRNTLRTRHPEHYLTKPCDEYMMRLIRHTMHMRYTIMSKYEVGNRETRNEELRIDYMRNRITEDLFKNTLQRNDKKFEKSREIHNVLTILLNTVTDIVNRFATHLREAPPNEFVVDTLEEVDPIVDYVNECLRDISKTYTSKVIQFSNDLRAK